MLVRFEPRNEGQYSTLVDSGSQEFWDLIKERCGSDVSDYLLHTIAELEDEACEGPSMEEFHDVCEYLKDHLAVEEYLYNFLDDRIVYSDNYTQIIKLLISWLRYMYLEYKPFSLDRHDDKTAEVVVENIDEYRKDCDRRWNS